MPKFLEDKLKKEYGANSKIPYKVMNKLGAMKGSKETAKGKGMEKKNDLKEQGRAIARGMTEENARKEKNKASAEKRKKTTLSNVADKMFGKNY